MVRMMMGVVMMKGVMVEDDEQVKKLLDRQGRLLNAHMKTSSQFDSLEYSASEIGTQFEWYHWSQISH